jgi:protein gp37
MGDRSKIEWTDASWNPIRARNLKTGKIGWHCEHATTGCEFCYSEGFNLRLGTGLSFKPGHRSDVELFLSDDMMALPLRWKKPRKIFVCSMTDLFADFVPDEWIDRVFAVMALCPQHTFQVLTKRAERMRNYVTAAFKGERPIASAATELRGSIIGGIQALSAWFDHDHDDPRPMANVWLGVSCERQQEADERIPLLLQTPAAIRFISAEPLLGPMDLWNGDPDPRLGGHKATTTFLGDWWPAGAPKGASCNHGVDWIIVGGESGRNARPVHPDWVRSLRDQCSAAEVPFFFKQWGEFWPADQAQPAELRGTEHEDDRLVRIGKKAAGRLLDGRTWDEFPEVRA